MPISKCDVHLNLPCVFTIACATTCVLFAVFVTPSVFADEAETSSPKTAAASAPLAKPQDTAAVKDPFSMSIPKKIGKTQFIPAPEGSPFPKITLRGIVIAKGKSKSKAPIALIEVDRYGTYVVRKDDTISLQKMTRGAADDKSVLRVIAISRQDVTVQMGSLEEKLIVR